MRLTRKCEYAIKALVELAIAYDRGEDAMLINDIAAREDIPPRYLEQILLGLKKTGVLISKRGVGGGYTLGRKPEDIKLGDIIRAVEGPLSSLYAPYAGSKNKAGDEVSSTLHKVMESVSDRLRDMLDKVSLKDMARTTLDMIKKKEGVLNYVI